VQPGSSTRALVWVEAHVFLSGALPITWGGVGWWSCGSRLNQPDTEDARRAGRERISLMQPHNEKKGDEA
jgi:hypothetical protein